MSITPEQIRAKFIDSLMNYYKIEEDVFLRQHIAELTQNIDPKQYRDFFNTLSTSEMPYKNPFEKIAHVAGKFAASQSDNAIAKRAKYLYNVMYELRKSIILSSDPKPALERFEQVYFSRIKDKKSDELLLNTEDLEVVRNLGKRWIFDNVAGDKTHFLITLTSEYEKLRRINTTQLSLQQGA